VPVPKLCRTGTKEIIALPAAALDMCKMPLIGITAAQDNARPQYSACIWVEGEGGKDILDV